MTKSKKFYKAVTLVELLAVIAIIGIMSAVGIVSLNSGKTSVKLQAAQREVASIIKLAQSYALQGKTVTYSGEIITPCGYGVIFVNSTSYEIFYNTWKSGGWGSVDNCADMNDTSNNRQWKNGSLHSQAAGSFQLKDGVTLSSPATATNAQIYFTIPAGNIYDKNGDAYVGPQTFTFGLGSSDTKSITIDSGGSVTESN